MEDEHAPLRWGIGQRLEFLEFRLFWEGQINRTDLMTRFGISAPQASNDFTKYVQLSPENMKYEPRQRTYLATRDFKPILYDPNARQFLADLRGIADDAVEKERTWLGLVPAYAITPTPRRRLDPLALRTILVAIRTNQAIRIVYQSMSSPEPTTRWITPHALAYDGARWNVRAWCNQRFEFLDFLLARMLNLTETRHHQINPSHDLEWNREIILRVGPRNELSDDQKRVVALDYGMTDGVLEQPLRLRMAYYFERNLLIDKDGATLSPKRVHLTLLNREELEEMRSTVKAEQELINHAIALGAEQADSEA